MRLKVKVTLILLNCTTSTTTFIFVSKRDENIPRHRVNISVGIVLESFDSLMKLTNRRERSLHQSKRPDVNLRLFAEDFIQPSLHWIA